MDALAYEQNGLRREVHTIADKTVAMENHIAGHEARFTSLEASNGQLAERMQKMEEAQQKMDVKMDEDRDRESTRASSSSWSFNRNGQFQPTKIFVNGFSKFGEQNASISAANYSGYGAKILNAMPTAE